MTQTDIKTWLADRLVPDADLDRPGLMRLAAAVRDEEWLWRQHVRLSIGERHYNQIYRDPNVDIWLICWTDKQDTGYHDHDRSQGAVTVCEGALFEDFFHRDADGWIREKTNRHEVKGEFDFDATYIHGVRYAQGAPAVSVHCYSPALWRMGHYEMNENGVMRRMSMTYADELLETVTLPLAG